MKDFVPALNISILDNEEPVVKKEEGKNVNGPSELTQISDEERFCSANVLFLRKLDEWIHLMVFDKDSKEVSFANSEREGMKRRVLNSYRNVLQASIDFYMQISEIASKQGYEKEAERYRMIAEIYDSIRCHNKNEA